MNKRVFLVCVIALAGLLACNREKALDEGALLRIEAEIAETKTALGEKDGAAYPNYWTDGDAISVNGVSSQPLSGVPAGANRAVFELSGVSAPYYAAYPAAAVSGYSAGGATVIIPAEQTWESGTYDPSAFVMLGKAEDASISFRNAVCLFKLTVKGSGGQSIRSVRLQANDSGIKLSGAFTTDFETLTAGGGAGNHVTVSSVSGVPLGEAFYIAMAPADFSKSGLTIEITDTDGGRMSRSANPSKAYEAGKVYAAEIEYAPDPVFTVHGYVRCSGNPLAGVVVSDGYIVTQTDADGHYSMQSAKQTGYVFVSLPSGFKADKVGVLPQFFKHTAQPEDVAEELDFDLLPDEGQENHTMLFFGDIHLANRTKDKTQFAKFTSEVNDYISANSSEKVYAMTLGDMTWDVFWYVNNFDLASYAALAADMPDLQIFHTIGNHDHDMNATGDWDTVNAFRTILAPNWYSFNIGKVHYMVVDNIECTNQTASTTNGDYRTYNTYVVSDILDWIKKDLQYVDKKTPIVVTMHAPVWNETGSNYLDNTSAFTSCFNGYSNVRFISGHTHKHRTVFKGNMTEINSGAVCAAWWWGGYYYPTLNITQDGAPNGYRIAHFNGTGMESRYKGVGRADDYQFRSYDRNTIKLDAASVGITASANASAYTSYIQSYCDYDQASSANEVIINVWDYDTTWKVEASEDNVHFTSCTRYKAYDPLYFLVYVAKRFKASAANPSFAPGATRHMFKYTASSANATVYIRVTDDEGRVYTETMTRPKAFKIATYQ